jgi:transposase InsO family protein
VHGEFQFCQCWRVLCSLANDWIASDVHRHHGDLCSHRPPGVDQLLVLSRSRKRAPRLTPRDRLLFGIGAFMVSPKRLPKIAIGIKPSTLLRFHRALIQRKYRLLFTPAARRRPGPKGPSKELIAAILEMKRRNPRFGCPRIAQQIAHAFGVEIGKDVVRRILAQHFRRPSGSDGPSGLTLIGDTADSLCNVDLFRCESIVLKSYWVMVVMDLFTRRIVGFGVAPTDVDGVAVCRMFNHAISGKPLPKHVSTDNDSRAFSGARYSTDRSFIPSPKPLMHVSIILLHLHGRSARAHSQVMMEPRCNTPLGRPAP